MMQENLLKFDRRSDATIKETMSVRNAATIIGVRTDDLEFWIKSGVVPLTDRENRLLKVNVEKLAELRRKYIGFNEYARFHENELFKPKLAKHRNALYEYLESKEFFGVEIIHSNRLPILLPSREEMFFERDKIEVIDENCKSFFDEFGLTEREKIQKILNEVTNEGIRDYIQDCVKIIIRCSMRV